MQLYTIARRLPEEIWVIFEPLLPAVVWCGEGRPPASNHKCLHGLFYVLIAGMGWGYVPPCFPCGRTIKERLQVWLEHDRFRTAGQQLARRYLTATRTPRGDPVVSDASRKRRQRRPTL